MCGAVETEYCAAPGLPWFHKVLDAPTTDYIEMRVCIDELTTNENVLISSYEIYVMGSCIFIVGQCCLVLHVV